MGFICSRLTFFNVLRWPSVTHKRLEHLPLFPVIHSSKTALQPQFLEIVLRTNLSDHLSLVPIMSQHPPPRSAYHLPYPPYDADQLSAVSRSPSPNGDRSMTGASSQGDQTTNHLTGSRFQTVGTDGDHSRTSVWEWYHRRFDPDDNSWRPVKMSTTKTGSNGPSASHNARTGPASLKRRSNWDHYHARYLPEPPSSQSSRLHPLGILGPMYLPNPQSASMGGSEMSNRPLESDMAEQPCIGPSVLSHSLSPSTQKDEATVFAKTESVGVGSNHISQVDARQSSHQSIRHKSLLKTTQPP